MDGCRTALEKRLSLLRRRHKVVCFWGAVFFSFLMFSPPFAPSAAAQDGSNSRIDRLYGGNLGLRFKWSGEGFSGIGSRADAMGGSISTLFSDAQSVAINPAGLGFARGFSVTFDWSPPLTVDPNVLTKVIGVGDLATRLNNELNEAARENSPNGVVLPGTVQEANVSSSLDMRGGLKGGAIMYGNPVFTIAAAFHQPFRLETQLNMSGMEFLAAALDDDGDETQRIFGTVNGNLNMELTIESSVIAAGTRLLPNLSVGLAYDNFNGEMNFASTFLPEGIISSAGGDTRAFNDPARAQYDSLFAITRGDWEGRAFRFRGGFGYHPTAGISLDAVFSLPFSMHLSGPFSMVHNNIRALDLSASSDEEVFDVDKLVEDNLTKTEKKVTKVNGIELQLAGSLALGFSSRWDNYVVSAVYTRYIDNLGYDFSYQQFDSLDVEEKTGRVQQGVAFGNGFRVGFGVRPMMLGLGFITGETFSSTIEDSGSHPVKESNNIILPFFSLGGGIRVSSHFDVDYVLSLYNSSFFRFSTTYRL